MLAKKKENLDKLFNVISELPEEKFSKVADYVMFLMMEEKQIFTEQMFFHVAFYESKKKEDKELNIPTFSCKGMNENFNRGDLYNDRF